MLNELQLIGQRACEAKKTLSCLETAKKNKVLTEAAAALVANAESIIEANDKDYENSVNKGMKQGLLDRLKLNQTRIEGIAQGMVAVAALEDPAGQVTGMNRRPNGLLIGQMRVPIGVIGVIYEARPNVTADVFALCFKSGNVCILRGGKDAINSNIAITNILRNTLAENGLNPDMIQTISDTSRETGVEFMHLDKYVDLLIPRGGAGLIKTVKNESTIPVIETGTGNCHIFVDESADIEMAVNIVFNAKTQRIGVCNAAESLLVHERAAEAFLPEIEKALSQKGVELRADETAIKYLKNAVPAIEEDWGMEYLDYIMSVKTVSDVDEAIDHINKYSTGHSESIITKNYENAQKFLNRVDSAAVYVNASTRFTDGSEFGFGAEIGISTQKLHARGPMGLKELTSSKYIIYGDGQVR